MPQNVSVVAIIPARYGSSRFPGKPLALLGGKPMIQHVYERVRGSSLISDVLVATDDERIGRAVEQFGGKAVLTSSSHLSGTDRVAEVAATLDAEVVVNVQGDEPLVRPEVVDQAVQPLLEDPSLQMTTLAQNGHNYHWSGLSLFHLLMEPCKFERSLLHQTYNTQASFHQATTGAHNGHNCHWSGEFPVPTWGGKDPV